MEFHRKLDLLFSHTTQHPAMEALFCNCPIALGSSPSSKTRKIHQSFPSKLFSHPQTSTQKENPSWTQNLLFPALAGSLSLTLLVSSPSFAVESSPPFPLQSPSSGYCQEAAEVNEKDIPPESVTNEGIVEEAWDVVSETFLDAGRNRWSPDKWQQMREDILGRTIKSRSKAHDVIRKMLATLEDPYTRFLSPAEFSKMARYDVTGIGINLREIPGEDGAIKLKVLGVILDGPAHSAGIRQGDEILAVNGVNVKGKSAFDVSSLIQGPKETFVTVEVKHGNCGPAQSFNVQRQVIARTPVFYRLEPLENGTASVGYIRLKEFNALARKDLVIAMKQLQDSGASYFILDLRDNLGGLVQAGIEVAKLFLNEGETIIYTVGRDPQFQNTIIAENAPMVTAPVIVLVNNRTASASEIVATALHDNCRAVLVGEQTYGKGLIQSVFELHDGSGVVVTVGKYVTPNHMDINGNGIEPDFPRMPAWSEVQKHLSQCRRKG